MWRSDLKFWNNEDVSAEAESGAPKDRIEKIKVGEGNTYGALMTNAGIPTATANQIYDASFELYDLAKVRIGKYLELVYDVTDGKFKKFVYKIDSEEELVVTMSWPDPVNDDPNTITDPAEVMLVIEEPIWKAEIIPIPYETKIKAVSGEVSSSLYQSALEHGMDDQAIIALANAYQWTIDFAMDARVGDTYKTIYEERYLDGDDVGSGNILAARYLNAGTPYYLFYFEESEENQGYFDENGNSVQKMFLRAPVEFRHISSGYTTGTRVVMEIGLVGPHMAIDYAAASGTPIRAVGDGVVASAGWNNGGYGNLVKIRHNGTYSTNYAHQSKILVRTGQHVKQGEIIGLVGSTGYSTGPHLHFEMVKNGAKVDPLKEILPPGKAIKNENRARFTAEMEKYKQQLDQE